MLPGALFSQTFFIAIFRAPGSWSKWENSDYIYNAPSSAPHKHLGWHQGQISCIPRGVPSQNTRGGSGQCPELNTLRPRQNGRHFADDILERIFLNENVWISIKISLNLVPKGPINNISALVQIMAWRRPGDKPESMMMSLLTHICVTRPQWVNGTQEC